MADDIRELCDLFSKALELEYVTPDTDFFLAGGHSLSALVLAIAVEEAFGIPTRVRDIFHCATPELLAVRLAATRDAGPPVPESSAPETETEQQAPGSEELPGQVVGQATSWLWLERQRSHGASSAYTVPCLLSGEGDLDVERLTAAVATLPLRHPALRTVFVEVRGAPRAVLMDRATVLEVVDLRTREITDAEFQSIVYEHVEVPFDPAAGPLFRSTLFLRPDGAWSLLFVADHLICDGRSLEILATDLVDAYARREPAGTAVAVPEPRPAGIRSREAAMEYWRKQLSPPPMPLPLPVIRPRLEPVGTETDTVVCEVKRDTVDRLQALARNAHAGPFVPLSAAVAHSLGALTGSADICLGTAVDRRSQLGLDGTVGFHVATVPLRLTVPVTLSPRELVEHVAARTMDVVDHSAVAFDELVATLNPPRSEGRTPFFDVWVALYPYIDTGSAVPGGIVLRGGPIPLRQGIFELSFQFVEHEDGLRLVLQYDARRYDADTAERMSRRVISDLERLTADADTAIPDETRSSAEGQVFQGFRFGS